MKVIKEIILRGFFWLPNEPQNQIAGTLSIIDGGVIYLSTIGSFQADLRTIFNNNDDLIERIVGEVEVEGKVTLDGCFYRKQNTSLLGGVSTSKISVNRCFFGVQYEKNESVIFDNFKFTIDGVDEWLKLNGINISNNKKQETVITFEIPEKINLTLSDMLDITFEVNGTRPGNNDVRTVKLHQNCFIVLKPNQSKNLEELLSLTNMLIDFFSFVTERQVNLKQVSANYHKYGQVINEKLTHLTDIKVFFQCKTFTNKKVNIDARKLLFTYDDIKESASILLKNWINAYDVFSPSLNLYSSSKTGAHRYLNSRFLSLAQALETYHRRTSDETTLSLEDFEILTNKIVNNFPENKEWLSARLMYGNELNLSKRIKRIIDPFKNLIGNKKQRSSLVRKIVNTRNYYTHFDPKLETEALTGKELAFLCFRMEALFELHLLKNLGFSIKKINALVQSESVLAYKLNPP